MSSKIYIPYLLERTNKLLSQRLILKNIVLGNLKARYAGSLLGVLWAIINPLLVMAVISFVFTHVINIGVDNFPLFVLSAILPWMSFSASIFDSALSITKSGNLLSQFTIAREILPIASVAANFINLLFGLIIMLPVFILFKVNIMNFILLLPLVILLHFTFTVGIGLLLSCANVFFRDIIHFLEVGLMFWFWMTPVFYSVDMVPARFRWICLLNPMTSYITMYRDILFEARMPSVYLIIIAVVMALIMLFIGYVVFLRNEESFLKKI